MLQKWSIVLALTVLSWTAYSQSNPADTTIKPADPDPLTDTTLVDYDVLFQDFEAFMDSILNPRSYFMPSLSVSRGFFSFTNKNNTFIETTPKITYSPMLTWYHKSGFGLSAAGYLVNDEKNFNLYQYSITPSFDYLKNHDLATGISYTRYISKDSLPFYTSPLRNELYAYFTYRKWWVKPMVAVSYGWGSRSDYEEREELIQTIRLLRRGWTYVNTKESVTDFSIVGSIRHDFYWLDVLSYNDHVRFTPLISFTSGTQKFGFNQTSNTYTANNRSPVNVLYSSESIYLDDQLEFQPLSLTLFLRGEYSIGKLFIQPQFMLDYYFPAEENKLSTLFSLTLGFVF